MTARSGPLPEFLGRFLLLHSALQAAPDEVQAAWMFVRAIEAVPGVGAAAVALRDASGATRDVGRVVEPGAPPKSGPAGSDWTCPIRTLRTDCGAVRLGIGDARAFATYAPFVANAANHLAMWIEAQRLQARIEALNRSLETALSERSRRYRTLFEQMAEGITILDPEMRVLEVNPAALSLLGVAAEDLMGQVPKPPLLCFVADDGSPLPDESVPSRRAALTGRAVLGVSIGLQRAAGAATRWFSVNAVPLFDGSAQTLSAVVVSFRDVTERREHEVALRIAATAFEAQDGIVVTDSRRVIRRVNRAFTRITGYSEQEAVGQTPALMRSGRHDAAFYAAMWETVARDGYWQGELCNRHKDGSLYTERLTISAVKDRDGKVTHYVGSLADVTQQREAESRVRQLAYFDALTGLPNRQLLYDRLVHAVAGSARSREYGAVLFIDLDNLKTINDTIGHQSGDEVLVQAARRMKATVRGGDTLARFGGDEFVVVLEGLGKDAGVAGTRAAKIGDKIRQLMLEKFDIGGRLFSCTASIGARLFVGSDDSPDRILMHADLAMYRAKQDGRNALRFFEEAMQVEMARRTTLEADLRQAVERHQLVLHYQPQYDRAGVLIGAEALVRWNHPERGLLPPVEFIGLAEETGLIVPIGSWILDEACRQLAAWAKTPGGSALVLAVNVSARQFAQDDFVARVRAALAAAGADPTRLKLELTESIVLDDVDDAFRKMRELKAAGTSFSLDDFGTGSSSLSYLTRLPLDQLKIDKSFVDDLPDDAQDAMVAQTIITMAKGLGLHVIAEGVETDAQWSFLMRNGCDAFQGYRFSVPLDIARFEAKVLHNPGSAHCPAR